MLTRIILFLMLLFSVTGSRVYASGFHISSIGGVDTGGIQYRKFWHTSSQPTIRGASLPSEEIKITIDGETYTINADSAGDWVFTPVTALAQGDHSFLVEGQGSSISFNLTIGSGNPDQSALGRGGGSEPTLPTVGFIMPTLIFSGLGGSLMVLGRRLIRKEK